MKISPFKQTAFFVLMVLVVSPILAAEGTSRLADGGVTDYAIVLPDEPTAVQTTAAGELASFLNRVTGAEFPILSERDVQDKEKLLVIGPGALSAKLLADAGAKGEESIEQDGIILQTAGQSLVFSGHPKRGPLYAVYTFLEDYVGCRWWTSTESTIPSRPTLDVEAVSIYYAPKVISREAYYLDPQRGREGGIFSARCKMNGNHNPVPPEYGGNEPFCMFVHTFYPILPPGQYFEEHPEWYALIDGQRRKENAQLCLTNAAMKERFIHNALRILSNNPDARIISISQNDCGGWCQCPECQKLVDENGSQAGPLITFVNDVAEAIEKEFPDVFVETLAYSDSRFAPSKVRPRDNVLIRLCTIEYSFLTPFEEGAPNQSLVDQIEKWSAISKQLFIWDYVTNFHNYVLPHPNFQVLAPNIRFFVKNRAIGIFEQGDAGCAAGDFVRLRDWVIAKLLWNPDLDQRVLENEFLNGYYSPRVGALLRQYLDVLTQSALDSHVYLRCYRNNVSDWLTPKALAEATGLMKQAIAAAKEDERQDPTRFAGLTKKVMRESIPIRFAWYRDWRHYNAAFAAASLPSPFDSELLDFLREMKTLFVENEVTGTYEGDQKENFDKWLADFDQSLNDIENAASVPIAAPPEEVKGLNVDSWFDAQEFYFRLASPGEWVFLEDDPSASNRRTARMPGTHTQWAVTWDSDRVVALNSPTGAEPDADNHARARVLLYARCDAPSEDSQEALCVGIYDGVKKNNLFARVLKAGELAGDEYKVIDLGTFPLGHGIFLWAAPRDGGAANVYIDRFVVIRE